MFSGESHNVAREPGRSHMVTKTFGIILICVAVFALTGAQLVIKNRLNFYGFVPFSPAEFLGYVTSLALDWRAWAGGAGLVVSAILWYAALSRVPLSLAYAFGALSYPLAFFGSIVILRENFSWLGLLGNSLVVGGVLLVAASH